MKPTGHYASHEDNKCKHPDITTRSRYSGGEFLGLTTWCRDCGFGYTTTTTYTQSEYDLTQSGYSRMTPDRETFLKRMREYAAIDYGTEAYPLSAAEAKLIVEMEDCMPTADDRMDEAVKRISELERDVERLKDLSERAVSAGEVFLNQRDKLAAGLRLIAGDKRHVEGEHGYQFVIIAQDVLKDAGLE